MKTNKKLRSLTIKFLDCDRHHVEVVGRGEEKLIVIQRNQLRHDRVQHLKRHLEGIHVNESCSIEITTVENTDGYRTPGTKSSDRPSSNQTDGAEVQTGHRYCYHCEDQFNSPSEESIEDSDGNVYCSLTCLNEETP